MGMVLGTPYAELWEGFLAFEKRRVSASGFKALRDMSYRLLKWLEEQDVPPGEVTVREALEYKAHVAGLVTKEGKPLSAGTCRNRLTTGRKLFRYAVTVGKRDSNPFMAAGYPRLPERINRNVLTEAQMNALLERLRLFTDAGGYQVHVLAELLYAAGLRIAEAAGLVPHDIDSRQRMVYVRQGKGGKSRTAFLTGYAAEVLEQYLARGRDMAFRSYCGPRSQGHTLFGIGARSLEQKINTFLLGACTALELPVITSHGFRHSLGTHLLRAGCDMRYIQVILGHENLRATQVYTHVDKDEVKASLDVHHPRQWKKTGEV